MANVIPEILIYNYLGFTIDTVKASVLANPADNLITKMFGTSLLGDYDIPKEAIKFFSKEGNLIDKRFGFNIAAKDSFAKPLMLITMPNEQETDSRLSGHETVEGGKDEIVKVFSTKFNVFIVSNNADVVIMLYRVFQALFMYFQDEMEVEGMLQMSFNGADLIMENGVMLPPNIYSRTLGIDFKYPIGLTYDKFITASTFNVGEQAMNVQEGSGKKLSIIIPKVGDSFVKNTSTSIAWQSIGDISKVDIYFSTDGGANYNPVILDKINDNVYWWNVGAVESVNCKIKIREKGNDSIITESGIFSITT